MKNHLKRLTSPKTWMINRKKDTFIVKSNPGAHNMEFSLPLGVILRDFIKKTHTMRETRKLLNTNQVLVDGKRRKDHRLPVGLFDVVSFPEIKKDFRVLLDPKGRLVIREIGSAENRIKPSKILGLTMLSKKLQLNLHDGKNILVDKNFEGKPGDTVVVDLPELKIKELLKMKPGVFVYVTKGKRSGDSGSLQEIKGNNAVYQKDGEQVETLKKYLFIIGDKEPLIKINFEPAENKKTMSNKNDGKAAE